MRDWWVRYRTAILGFMIFLMAIIAAHRLYGGFYRLLSDRGIEAAVDLKLRYKEVHLWFAGQPVYEDVSAVYPPATYAMLWPVLGWPSFETVRWLWAVTSIFALAWLIQIILRRAGATGRLEKVFVALLPLSMYATGAIIGNGQLLIHLLPVILFGLVRLQNKSSEWKTDLWIGILISIPLAKLNVSLPFFWMALFLPETFRPAVVAAVLYGALTLVAIPFQNEVFFSLIGQWLARSTETVVTVKGGYANLHTWLIALGLEGSLLPVSFLLLALLGIWTYYYRRSDIWLLSGVTAIVARFWSYHLFYDDLLMLIPVITLFRLAKEDVKNAGILCAITLLSLLVTPQMRKWPLPSDLLFQTLQTIVWLLSLLFLLNQTRRRSGVDGGGALVSRHKTEGKQHKRTEEIMGHEQSRENGKNRKRNPEHRAASI